MKTSVIPSLAGFEGFEPIAPFEGQEAPRSSSFIGELKEQVGTVNRLLNEADKKSVDLVTGKQENLHESMIALEKAETSLKMMMQIRNKALEAYNDILRMQF